MKSSIAGQPLGDLKKIFKNYTSHQIERIEWNYYQNKKLFFPSSLTIFICFEGGQYGFFMSDNCKSKTLHFLTIYNFHLLCYTCEVSRKFTIWCILAWGYYKIQVHLFLGYKGNCQFPHFKCSNNDFPQNALCD